MAKILIAEDDHDIRTAYVFAFSKAGYETLEAANGTQAMSIMLSEHPHVILLDMLMPGMSGLDFLRQAEIKTKHAGIKVVAFSNIDTPRVVEEAKSLGASDYLIKVDITPHQMVEIVNGMIGDLAPKSPK
jgi:two-component system response regulator (stage 0 sporulation protein F)